jgi:hypothetical protein
MMLRRSKMKRILLSLFILTASLIACVKDRGTNIISGTTLPPTAPPPADTSTVPVPGTIDATDTLKVVAYNVLNYGDGCQGTMNTENGYFKTIIQYIDPDLLSCEKMDEFSPTSVAPNNLAAVITDSVLNAVFPGRYAFATPTNTAGDVAMSCLFYNRQKLTYIKTETLVVDVSDFDMYKLYYNDPDLSITHDTTFLYVVVNHTQSGNSSTTRDQQVTQEMLALRNKFSYFPNLIDMGDFNVHNSSEAGYQSIINATDTNRIMSDPSFYPDRINTYPADWDNNPASFTNYLTTSTRLSSTIPNSCGTNGGAKSWYDHIFISPWLVKGSNYIKYISNSYQTIGNDGHRLNVDINSNTPVVNASAPSAVINALFQFSNKYPVSIKLLIKANRTGAGIADPAEIH